MKNLKKAFALILITALAALSVSACKGNGGSGSKGETNETIESVLEKMEAATKEVKSSEADYNLDLKMLIKVQGMSMDMVMNMTGVTKGTTDPNAAYIDMDMNIEVPVAGAQNQKMEAYVVPEGDEYVMYSTSDGGESWSAVTVDASQAQEMVGESGQGMVDLYKNGLPIELQGTEKFEGTDCFLITGDIGIDDLTKIMEKVGSSQEDSLSSLEGLVGETGEDIVYHLSMYVNTSDYTLKGLSVDMKDAMDKALKASFESQGLSADSVEIVTDAAEIKVVYTSYNSVDEITVPDDVKAAAGR